MSKPYGTHPVIIPATGAPICAGVALKHRHAMYRDVLDFWARPGDSHGDAYQRIRDQSRRATHDGYLLCLRPTATEPAAVGLTPTQFADASLRADFAERALVVDPYDADGNDIRERPGLVSGHTQQAVEAAEAGDVLDFIDRQNDLSTRLILLGC